MLACRFCGVKNLHHPTYENLCRVKPIDLRLLCIDCHTLVHEVSLFNGVLVR